jgi:hypothetical protein
VLKVVERFTSQASTSVADRSRSFQGRASRRRRRVSSAGLRAAPPLESQPFELACRIGGNSNGCRSSRHGLDAGRAMRSPRSPPGVQQPRMRLGVGLCRGQLLGSGRDRAVSRNAGSDRPDCDREEADKEAVAEHAVFAGADDERKERDEEGNRPE